MTWQYPAYVLPLLLATATLVALAFYTWRRRSTPGAGTFALLMLAAAWWALMYMLELGSVGLENKVIWAKAKYLGVVASPVAWLAFALQYTGRGRWLTKRNLALLSIVPLATLALVATNEAHYLIWEPEINIVGALSVLHMGYGTWFWVQTAYSYPLILLGTILLLWAIIPALRLYFPQNLALLMGVLIPWAANALYIFRLSPVEDLDPTPFAFVLTGIAIAWGLLRFRLLDVVPVARGAIVERIPAGIVVVDDQERIVDLNPAAQRILGRPVSSAVGRRTRDLLPDLANLLELHRDEKEVRVEVSLGNGSGSRDYVLDLSPLPDKNGGSAGRLILLHDITRRKETEESLRGSEAKFRSVVESIGEALLITDKNDVVTFMNPRVTDLTGYTEEDLLGRPAYELFLPPEEWPVLFERNQRRTRRISERYETRLKRSDGELIWVEINATPYRNADGEIVGTLGAIVDITGRKRSEERLREAEELFRTTFEKTPVGMALVGLDGYYLRVNEALCQILGYSREEFLSTNFSEITHPEDQETSQAHTRRMLDGEMDSYTLEKRYLHGGGYPVWVSLSVSVVRDSEGNPLHHIAQVQDISQWKSIEETLRESEQRFRQLFDQSVDPLLIHDDRGNIVDCNPEACRAHGYTREEMVSLSVKDLTDNLISEEERQARERDGGTLWQRALAGDLGTASDFHLGEHKRKDGTTFPVEVLVGGLDYAGRRLILASVRDTTERKRIENALRESEERFRTLVQYGSDIIAILEADGTIRYESPAVERVLGYRPEETVGNSVFDYLHPDDLEKTAGTFFEGIEANWSTGMAELRFRHADGSWRHIEAIGINLLDDPAVGGIIINSRDITGRKKAEEELRESEERFRTIFEGSGVGISIADLDRKLLQTNVAYQEMTGYGEDELYGKPIAELSHPDEVPDDKELNERLLSGEIDRYQREKRYIRKDGEIIWAKPTVSAVRGVGGEPLFLVGVVEDVTERKRAEDALRESEERFRQLFEHSVDLLFVHDEEGRIFECNTEACRALGHTREELRNSMVGDIAAKLLTEEERERRGTTTLWERAMRSEPGRIVGFEQNELRRADGSVFPVEIGVGTIDYGGRRMIFASARDITEHKVLEERLTYQAFHDPLTHLPNRALFLERLQHALSRLSRRRCCIAVLFMDLDNFKVINDSLGHELGDRLLRAVSGRLKTCLRPEDTVARFGGDEFTMLLEDVGDVEEAKTVAGRILEAVRSPFELQQQQVFADISLGIVLGTSDQDDPEDLLRNADTAMYEAKRNGKAQYKVFEPGMTIRLQERLELEVDLRRAIEEDEFVVYYQPEISLETGEVYGFEALVRWEHPSRGLMLPKQFIPLAEETGLILPIERKVLKDACQNLREWQRRYPSLAVSVNLYQRQLQQPDLIGQIEDSLRDANLAPHNLMLEITEEVVMTDEKSMLETLRALKARGVRLAIDDFGTGYSSLDYLKRLPVDYLKIDRSFIEGLGEDHKDQVIVSSAISLAHALDLKVVAEGVETAEQLEQLKGLGCELAQGYYFARALTKDEVPAFLASGNVRI